MVHGPFVDLAQLGQQITSINKWTPRQHLTVFFSPSPLIFIQITTTIPNENQMSWWRTNAQKTGQHNKERAEHAVTLVWDYAHWTEPVIQQCSQRVCWGDHIMPPSRTSSLRSRLPWCISVGKKGERWEDVQLEDEGLLQIFLVSGSIYSK